MGEKNSISVYVAIFSLKRRGFATALILYSQLTYNRIAVTKTRKKFFQQT